MKFQKIKIADRDHIVNMERVLRIEERPHVSDPNYNEAVIHFDNGDKVKFFIKYNEWYYNWSAYTNYTHWK